MDGQREITHRWMDGRREGQAQATRAQEDGVAALFVRTQGPEFCEALGPASQ